MPIPGRRFLRAGMVAAGVAAAGGAVAATGAVAHSAKAQASTRTWLVPRYGTFSNLNNTSLGGDPEVCQNASNHAPRGFHQL